MAVKFYKKFSPGTPVIFGQVKIEFSSVDGLLGYYATDSEELQAYFVTCMQEQRYGLSEISQAEFTADYVEKKTADWTPKKWREEMHGSSVRATGYDPVAQLGGEKVAAVLGVSAPSDVPGDRRRRLPVTMEEAAPTGGAPVAVAEKKPFVPTVGKRKPLKE